MTKRTWLNRNVVGIGEAMVEFAPMGKNTYRRGFAGDTLNTCWHIAQIVGDHGEVGYFTRVGTDPFSVEFLDWRRAESIQGRSTGMLRARLGSTSSVSPEPSEASATGATRRRRGALQTIPMSWRREFRAAA